MKLLTHSNTKTVKGEKLGYMTFILHLAPASLSGYNVCPASSVWCRKLCLNTSGRGRFDKTQNARIRRTVMFFENREQFMWDLVCDILAAMRKAERENMIPVFRLNGTSDIRWENVPVGEFPNIMTMFPDLTFYDYTKIPNRRNLPENYHLTFSRSEDNEDVNLPANVNIAVVFDTKKGVALPSVWNGRRVIDGDEHDVRFLDPKGVVVGLRGKGLAVKEKSNRFVVTVEA